MDRGLTIWDNYKSYLKPLGVKKIRLQGGWAKCEKVKGVYDWQWLDDVINYAVANGLVHPEYNLHLCFEASLLSYIILWGTHL